MDGRTILGHAGGDGAGALGFNLVHDLHGLDDAQRLSDRNSGADIDEVRGVRGGFDVEGADHRGVDFRAVGHRYGGGSGRGGRSGNRGCRGECRCLPGGKSGKQAAQVIEVGPLFELEVKVLFGEVEMGEPVLVHEFDDSADFLEVHDEKGWELDGERLSGGTLLVRGS